jgi:hypothetical protein
MLKFGADKIFSGGYRAATDAELDEIIDRTGKVEDTALKATKLTASTFDATTALRSTRLLKVANRDDFVVTSHRDIGDQWKAALMDDKSRKARAASKQRLMMIAGSGSGYGAAMVPVLKANNYALLDGESSVFQTELSVNRSAYGVPKKVRCAFSDRILHSRMPLDPTHVRLKRTCCDQLAFLFGGALLLPLSP